LRARFLYEPFHLAERSRNVRVRRIRRKAVWRVIMKDLVAIALGIAGCALSPSLSSAQQPMPVQRGMARVSEPVLYYETAGKGPAVVLIHGGNLDRRMWDDQFQEFAKQFQVIRYDVRTYGLSELPTRPYSDVDDLESLLRFLHIKKAHLVG